MEVRPSPEFPGPPPPGPTHHLLHPRRPGEKNRAGSSTPGGGRRPRRSRQGSDSEAAEGEARAPRHSPVQTLRGQVRGGGATCRRRGWRVGSGADGGEETATASAGTGTGRRRRRPVFRLASCSDRSRVRLHPAGRHALPSPRPRRAHVTATGFRGGGEAAGPAGRQARAPGEGTRRGGPAPGAQSARVGAHRGEGARAGRTGRARGGRAPGEGARAPGGGHTSRRARAVGAHRERGARREGGARARSEGAPGGALGAEPPRPSSPARGAEPPGPGGRSAAPGGASPGLARSPSSCPRKTAWFAGLWFPAPAEPPPADCGCRDGAVRRSRNQFPDGESSSGTGRGPWSLWRGGGVVGRRQAAG